MTDTVGLARAIAIPPGVYDVTLELSGFATVVEKDVTLRVGQTLRLVATLKVAQVAETVNVVAVAPLVDVYKTDSSTNIVPEQIESLPVADRDFQRLAFLTPGVQRERGGNRFIGNAPVIGAAGNASQATIMVDGVDFTDPVLGLARARFSQEAISEFRVIANRFDPEIGGSAGGALSVVTKSGTNDLTGSAFGFFRDKSLRKQGALDLQKNAYSRQQFGGTLGGPIAGTARTISCRSSRWSRTPLWRFARAARTRRRPRICRFPSRSRSCQEGSTTRSAVASNCACARSTSTPARKTFAPEDWPISRRA